MAANVDHIKEVDLKSLIPERPPDSVSSVVDSTLNSNLLPNLSSAISSAVMEPSLASLGLASWWPSGRFQSLLEFAHVSCGMSWIQSIVACLLVLRLVALPLNVLFQKNTSRMAENMPVLEEAEEELRMARARGNVYEIQMTSQRMRTLMKKNKMNPIKDVALFMVNGGILMSMLIGLRQMSYLPVASLETAGLAWFPNLTVPDPIYLLPLTAGILTATQCYLAITGQTAGTLSVKVHKNSPWMLLAKKLYFLPGVMVFLVGMKMHSVLVFYWCCNSVLTLIQIGAWRVDVIRTLAGLPTMAQERARVQASHERGKKSGSKKSYLQSFKDGWNSAKVFHDVQDRRVHDERMFLKAAQAAPLVTYKFDPTRPIRVKSRSIN